MPRVRLRVSLVVLSCMLSAATGLLLSRGGPSSRSPAPSGRRPLIGLSMDTLKEERWQSDRDFFVARARELGAEVLVQAANSDDARQIQDVEALISRGVGALVIVPHNGEAMAKAVELAHAAGIPVIAYDRMIMGIDVDLYISFDAVKIGEAQGRYLVDLFRGKGKKRIVRVLGAKTDRNVFFLKEGQDRVLAPLLRSGELEIVHEDWADNWKPENAKKIVQAAITRLGPRFDAVLAANDGTAGGAAQALLEEGLTERILVTGQDAELAACQRVVRGTQAMTVYKPLPKLAGLAAETAIRMAAGRPVVARDSVDNHKTQVPAILLDVTIVTKENMDDTVIRDGFHSREAVYGAPGAARP